MVQAQLLDIHKIYQSNENCVSLSREFDCRADFKSIKEKKCRQFCEDKLKLWGPRIQQISISQPGAIWQIGLT